MTKHKYHIVPTEQSSQPMPGRVQHAVPCAQSCMIAQLLLRLLRCIPLRRVRSDCRGAPPNVLGQSQGFFSQCKLFRYGSTIESDGKGHACTHRQMKYTTATENGLLINAVLYKRQLFLLMTRVGHCCDFYSKLDRGKSPWNRENAAHWQCCRINNITPIPYLASRNA